MNQKELRLIKLDDDIKEIFVLLNSAIFDKDKAKNIIKKHNLSNAKVALFNSLPNVGFVPFENATDAMMKENLKRILAILMAEYEEELKK